MNNKFEEFKKRAKITITNGDSVLGGLDYKNYPKHCFKCNKSNSIAMPFNVVSVGHDYWRKNCFRFRKNSNTFALELVINGVFEFEQNNSRYTAKANDLFIVRERANSAMFCSSLFAEKYTIIISGGLLNATLLELGLSNVDYIPEISAKIYNSFEKIEGLFINYNENSQLEAACEIFKIFNILSAEKKTTYNKEFQNIIDFINIHLDQRLTLNELKNQFKISTSTLARLFKENLDDTVLGYILKCKMSTASRLLTLSELSIKEISAMLGYSNQLYFSTSFTKFFGIPPRKYRLEKHKQKYL